MNDFEHYRRCSPLNSLQHYSWGERSMPMAVSHAMRSDVRACPTRPNRNPPPPEPDIESSNGQPRRRIAVACARCRKRKIRCSGDPGNNSGCQNCRAAGADISACQFHRVGSYTPGPSIYNYSNAIPSNPSLPMNNIYHGHSNDYSYSPHPKGLLSTRAYPSYTNIGYGDESPTDSYGYQPLPLPGNDMFAGFLGSAQEPVRGWSSMGHKQTAPSAIYLDDPSPASYSSLPLPYLSNIPVTRQHIATADNLSAFSMNSLQSSLASPPAPPHPSLPSSLENRHLPIPTATRMQIAPSTEIHLRAHPTSAVSLTNALPYTKASMTWNPESTVHPRQNVQNASSACQMMNAPDGKPSAVSSLQDSAVIGYIANNSPDNSSNPSSSTVYTPSSLSGATPSSLDEKYTASNAVQSSSSIREDGLPRNDSTTSLAYYGTESSSSKHNTSNEQSSQESALISGQRYAPLQPQAQHTSAGIEQLRRDSFDQHRAAPSHRASISSLNERRF